MENIDRLLIILLILLIIILIFRGPIRESTTYYPIQQENRSPEVQRVDIIETNPLPYWTAYSPSYAYWPQWMSPYWYYDVPYYGPITGRSNYIKPWGYSGKSVGGGGGGGHGGHGGGGKH
jgi:hypothetical protein